jgi:hypothetical protein
VEELVEEGLATSWRDAAGGRCWPPRGEALTRRAIGRRGVCCGRSIWISLMDLYKSQGGIVCRLMKSLYGLKQAPKQWHDKFDQTLTSDGFVVNEADKCVLSIG